MSKEPAGVQGPGSAATSLKTPRQVTELHPQPGKRGGSGGTFVLRV